MLNGKMPQGFSLRRHKRKKPAMTAAAHCWAGGARQQNHERERKLRIYNLLLFVGYLIVYLDNLRQNPKPKPSN